ncbi:MAG TPA: hypothetical protein VIC57_15120 [Candidatus Dormibacteraeota bacterium]
MSSRWSARSAASASRAASEGSWGRRASRAATNAGSCSKSGLVRSRSRVSAVETTTASGTNAWLPRVWSAWRWLFTTRAAFPMAPRPGSTIAACTPSATASSRNRRAASITASRTRGVSARATLPADGFR